MKKFRNTKNAHIGNSYHTTLETKMSEIENEILAQNKRLEAMIRQLKDLTE